MRWCFCKHLTPLPGKSFLTVIMHRKETALTSNTASLALKMLPKSELIIRGEKGDAFDFTPKEGHQPLYLFPSEDAQVLTKEFAQSFGKPIQLIMPDGTWRQAKKFHKREPALASIPRVRVDQDLQHIYTLRKSPVPGGVCSLEAIAMAMGILDGDEVRDGLLQALRIMNRKVEVSRNPKLWKSEEGKD